MAIGMAVSVNANRDISPVNSPHRLDGVREGTVIAAVVTGKVFALVKKSLSPLVQRICFGGTLMEAKQ